ncbi:hypothetical protein ACETRX_27505 [Labrys portucalensis]|uniref:TonB C-terminal domain-containing protein n=1 Tax=Labrys neptuniae TaxID=376174 RepID=A0ABV6ZMP5_9HYPH
MILRRNLPCTNLIWKGAGLRSVAVGLTLIACFAIPGAAARADRARIGPAQIMQMQEILTRAMRPCVAPAIGQSGTQWATVRIFFNRDSTLARRPELVAATSATIGANVLRAATRCLARKDALRFDERSYDAWKIIDLKWTPGTL